MLLSSRSAVAGQRAVAAFPSRPVPAVRRPVAARAAATKEADVKADKAEKDSKPKHDGPDVQPGPGQVATLLNTLVNDTEIAELHLQIGSFELLVRRSTAGLAATPSSVAVATPAPAAVAAPVYDALDAPAMNTAATIDESLVFVLSPKVGTFRRGGGKGKPGSVEVGTQVKKGQAVGYVEQLGTLFPLEAPQAGEIVKFELEDGKPVEYKQSVAVLTPFFGGSLTTKSSE